MSLATLFYFLQPQTHLPARPADAVEAPKVEKPVVATTTPTPLSSPFPEAKKPQTVENFIVSASPAPGSVDREPASAETKKKSYFVQQERKRFLAACLAFERTPQRGWKKLVKVFPEIKNPKATDLTSQWTSLAKIVSPKTSKSNRNTASEAYKSLTQATQDYKKLRELRQRFVGL